MAKGYKKSEPLNRWVALIFAVITMLLGTLFTFEVFFSKPILREEATEVSGVFKDFSGHQKLKGGFSEVSLFFADGSRQYIDSCCVSEELLESLEKTPKGIPISLLVNPNNDYVVELVANGKVLLDFDYAQKALEGDSIVALYLGVFLYSSSIVFVVHAVRDFKRKSKQKKIKRGLDNNLN